MAFRAVGKRSALKVVLLYKQDQVDEQKEALLTNIEKMLAQKEVFTIKWKNK